MIYGGLYMDTRSSTSPQQSGKALAGLLYLITGLMIGIALSNANLGAALGVVFGFLLGWLCLAASCRGETGQWPLAKMRELWK
jgi:hypothetical protein